MHQRCMSEILLLEKKWLSISTNWDVFVLFNCASSPPAAPAAAVTQTRWRHVERNRTRTSYHPEVFTCRPYSLHFVLWPITNFHSKSIKHSFYVIVYNLGLKNILRIWSFLFSFLIEFYLGNEWTWLDVDVILTAATR